MAMDLAVEIKKLTLEFPVYARIARSNETVAQSTANIADQIRRFKRFCNALSPTPITALHLYDTTYELMKVIIWTSLEKDQHSQTRVEVATIESNIKPLTSNLTKL